MAFWRSHRSRWLALLSTLCSATSDVPAQTVRDSAHIRIVMNAKPSWTRAQQLRLSATPALVIGNRDDEPYQLTRIRGAFYLSDGRLVLGESASNEVRIFDLSGKHLKTFGRKGDGPGEFRSFGRVIKLSGDTIAVIHDEASVSRFTGDGKYIARTDDRGLANPRGPRTSVKSVLLPLDGGARLVASSGIRQHGDAVGSEFDASAFHEIISGTNAASGKPGSLPMWRAVTGKDGPDQRWLGAEEVYAGNGVQFYLGYGTQYSLTRYSLQGIPNLIIRREWKAAPVTRKDFEEFTEEWLRRWSKSTGAKLEADRKEQLAMDYFKSLPAFSALILDNIGQVWVRTPKAIDGAVAGSLNNYSIGASTWSVFSSVSIWLGDVSMPPLFEPTEIGVDYVLGIARDADLTPTIVRYKLGTRP